MKNFKRSLPLILSALSVLSFIGCNSCFKTPESNKAFQDDYESVEWIHGNWWEIFEDDTLTFLIEESVKMHPSLQIARSRIALASFEAKEAKSFLFPTLDFNGDSTKYVQSKTGIFAPPEDPNQSVFPLRYTQTEINFDFNYEFDFFEKNKNYWRAALGEVQAVKFEEMISRLVLSLSVADTYFRLKTDKMREEISNELFENRNQIFNLTSLSMRQGLSTSISRNIAETDVLSATEKKYGRKLDVALDYHLLQSLVASDVEVERACLEMPLDVLEHKSKEIFANLLTELPLDLIGYRADIQAILNRIRAAGFQIKAAEALFYPNINLVALTGLQTIRFHELLKDKSFYGVWGPAIHLPIFDGGFLKANLGTQKTQYQILVSEYEEKILNATKQVLDAKSSFQIIHEQLLSIRAIKERAYDIVQLTDKKLRGNLSSKFDLINAKASYLDVVDREVELQFLSLHAFLNLIRALGGGYQ